MWPKINFLLLKIILAFSVSVSAGPGDYVGDNSPAPEVPQPRETSPDTQDPYHVQTQPVLRMRGSSPILETSLIPQEDIDERDRISVKINGQRQYFLTVPVNDPTASPLRIMTQSGVKALKRVETPEGNYGRVYSVKYFDDHIYVLGYAFDPFVTSPANEMVLRKISVETNQVIWQVKQPQIAIHMTVDATGIYIAYGLMQAQKRSLDNGQIVWDTDFRPYSRAWDPCPQGGASAVVVSADSVFISGSYNHSFLDYGACTANGNGNGFLVKLNKSDGVHTNTQTYDSGGGYWDYYSFATLADDSIYTVLVDPRNNFQSVYRYSFNLNSIAGPIASTGFWGTISNLLKVDAYFFGVMNGQFRRQIDSGAGQFPLYSDVNRKAREPFAYSNGELYLAKDRWTIEKRQAAGLDVEWTQVEIDPMNITSTDRNQAESITVARREPARATDGVYVGGAGYAPIDPCGPQSGMETEFCHALYAFIFGHPPPFTDYVDVWQIEKRNFDGQVIWQYYTGGPVVGELPL